MMYDKAYQLFKRNFPGAIVFLQIGEFYEAFGDDAKTAADVCKLYIRRNMCGFPVSAHKEHVKSLNDKGFKVALISKEDLATQAA